MFISYEFLTICIMIIGSIVTPIVLYRKKKEAENNKIVFDLVMKFQKEIIPYYLEILDFYKRNKLDLLETLDIDALEGKIIKTKKMKLHTDKFLNKVMLLFNDMDSFASGILLLVKEQEHKAFLMQGRAYCDIINTFKCIYTLYKFTNKQDYLNLIQLYEKWNNRLLRNMII